MQNIDYRVCNEKAEQHEVAPTRVGVTGNYNGWWPAEREFMQRGGTISPRSITEVDELCKDRHEAYKKCEVSWQFLQPSGGMTPFPTKCPLMNADGKCRGHVKNSDSAHKWCANDMLQLGMIEENG